MYYDPLASTEATQEADSAMPPNQNRKRPNQNGGNSNDGSATPPQVLPPNEQPNVLPNDSIDPKLLSLAMGFVPYQSWEIPYADDVGLSRGTIFPSLDKPFLGERPLTNRTPSWEA